MRGLLLIGAAMLLNACAVMAPFRDQGPGPAPAEAASLPLTPQDEVLAAVGWLPAGESMSLSNGRVARADATYDAASGRRCREVEISGDGGIEKRLACRDEGVWGWYPNVLP